MHIINIIMVLIVIILFDGLMLWCQDPYLFEKIWYNVYNDHTNDYMHSILIVQVLHVMKDYLSYIYINTKITTTTATVTSEPGFAHGVCGDPSLLSLLSLSTIVPIFINTDVLTMKFDKVYNTSVIMILYLILNVNKKKKVRPVKVIMGVSGGRLISAAILMAFYLFSCLIAAITLILAVFDEFNQDPTECTTTMNYYIFMYVLYFSVFETF